MTWMLEVRVLADDVLHRHNMKFGEASEELTKIVLAHKDAKRLVRVLAAEYLRRLAKELS
jgi:hypothetical protein